MPAATSPTSGFGLSPAVPESPLVAVWLGYNGDGVAGLEEAPLSFLLFFTLMSPASLRESPGDDLNKDTSRSPYI